MKWRWGIEELAYVSNFAQCLFSCYACIEMLRHTREWMSQASKRMLELNAVWNAPIWPCLSESLCGGSLTNRLLTKPRGRGWMSNALHRVDWSLVVSLGEMDKSWVQTNYRRSMKHKAVRSSASEADECIGHPRCLAPSEERLNRVVSHRSLPGGLGDHQTVLPRCRLDHLTKGLG